MAVLMTPPYLTFFDNSTPGIPLAGGKIYTYAAGTTTPKATFTDNTEAVPATNPIVLDAQGRATPWISGSYKFVIYDALGNLIRTTDGVTSYSIAAAATNAYFQTFSGDGATTVFTVSQDLGTDENALFVDVDAGGGKGYDPLNPNAYTINGTTLTFASPPAVGVNNIFVRAPLTLLNAASAAAAAAATSETNAAASAVLASQWASLTSGIVATTDYSAKAWAIGGIGVTGVSAKGAAKEWATLTSGAVDTSGFSAKAWAVGGTGVTTSASGGAAKEWATTTGGAVDTSEFSAKEYAIGTTATVGSAKSWASLTSAAVAGGVFSAKEYAQGTQASTGGSSKNWSQQTGADVTGAAANSRSAKSWAQEDLHGATLGGSAKDWAQSASLPDGTSKSAKSYATDAAGSATTAAGYAASLTDTSTTSLAIGTGAKVFTVSAAKAFAAGQFISAASAANNANYMHGQVTSYTGTTLTINVTDTGGSGTKADWQISIAGSQGAVGPAGSIPIGAAGGTADVITVTVAPVITLADQTVIIVLSVGANTVTTPTLNVGGLGAKTVTARGGAALAVGDTGPVLYAMQLEYNLANTRWELMNPAKVISADIAGVIAEAKGGTNQSTYTLGDVLYSSGANTLGKLAVGSTGQVLVVAGGIPSWGSGITPIGYNAQSSTYAPVAGDNGKVVDFTGSSNATWTMTSAVTLGAGWWCILQNSGTSSAILSLLSSAGTLDGVAAGTGYKMYGGEKRLIYSDGSNFRSIVLSGFSQKFLSSGSWTIPPGYKEFRQRIWSSGQSGAARLTTGNAAGGAGGAYMDVTLDASKFVAAGSSETLTISGTIAGVSGNTAGNISSFSSFTLNGVTITCGYTNAPIGANVAPTTAALAAVATQGAPSGVYGYGSLGSGIGGGEVGGGGGDVTVGNVPEYINGAQWPLSVHSGAGGGACSSAAGGVRTGGTSIYGGNGGAGGLNTGGNGTNGTVPGGGGGGAVQGGTSGSGAAGQIIISGTV